jgi:hypothetical protein
MRETNKSARNHPELKVSLMGSTGAELRENGI